ncbi:MAG TPA: transporter substrate-binding domain-containing protein [Rhodocyclaceae bacterium]|nr:transporter substrate-binding domain-containing protein [Rhodocyclaceae bacterium]
MVIALKAAGAAEPLRIETIHGPPWGFVGSDGKPTGMMYEIGNRIAEEAGLTYTNTLSPYARTAHSLESGAADLVLRFTNEQMTRDAVQVATIVTMPIIIVGQPGTRYKSLSELRGKTVGVVRTSAYTPEFDTDNAIRKYAVNDYVTMAKMIVMNRLDAGVGSSVGFYYSAHQAGIKPADLGPPLVIGSNDFVLHFSRKNFNQQTANTLKDAVKRLTDSGEIKRIVIKYTGLYETDKSCAGFNRNRGATARSEVC